MKRPWARRLVGLVALLVAVWVALAAGVGMRLLVPRALGWAAPAGWEIGVRTVRGGWFSSIQLGGVEAAGPGMTLSVERLVVRYRVLPLFGRTIDLEEVRLIEPRITLHRTDPGSPPDLSTAEPTDTAWSALDIASSSPLGGWVLELDDVDIVGGSLRVHLPNGTHRSENLRARARGVLTEDGLDLVLDTLAAELDVPVEVDSVGSKPGSIGGRLALSGELLDGVLDVGAFTFVTERSEVHARGRLLLADPGRTGVRRVDRVDFSLSAEPLDLRDLPLTLPQQLAQHPEVRLDLVARGPLDSIAVDGRLEAVEALVAEVRAVSRAPDPSTEGAGPSHRPAIDGTLELRGADLAAWAPAPFDGVVSGRIHAVLDRWSPEATLRAEASLTHEPATPSDAGLLSRTLKLDATLVRDGVVADTLRTALDSTRASVRLTGADVGSVAEAELRASGGGGVWTLDVGLDGGGLEGGGRVAWSDSLPTLVVEWLEADAFDLSAIDDGLPETALSGLLEGRMAGTAPQETRGRLVLRLDSSRFADTTLDTLRLTADLEDGTARGALLVVDSAYRASTEYTATLRDSLVRASLRDVRIASRAPAADTAGAELALWARAEGRWRLGTEEPSGRLEVGVDSARAAGVVVRSGDIIATLEGQEISGGADLALEGVLDGSMRVDATFDVTGAVPSDMVGRLEATAALAQPIDTGATAPDTVGAPAAGRSVGVAPADSLRLVATADEPGRFRLDGWIRPAEGGEVELAGTTTLEEARTTFDVSAFGSLDTPSDRLMGAALDSLRLSAAGTRVGMQWAELDASMRVTNARWREISADTLWMEMSYDSAGLRLDTARVDSNVLLLAGSGHLPASAPSSGSVELVGELRDLEPVRTIAAADVLGAEAGDLRLTATGALDSLTIASDLRLQAIAWRDVRVIDLNSTATATLDREEGDRTPTLVSAQLDLTLDRIALPDTDIRNVEIGAEGGPDSIVVVASAIVDDQRTGNLLVQIDPRPEYRTATIEEFGLQLDRDEWTIVEPAVVSYGEGVRVDSFAIAARESRIAIDGGVDAGGALDLAVDVDSTDVGTVSDLLGLRGLDGWLGGRLRLQGTTSAPAGYADLRGAFRRPDGRMGPASMELVANGSRVAADIDLVDADGGRLMVDGSLPVPLGGDGLAVVLDTLAIDLPDVLPELVEPGAPGAPEAGALDLTVQAEAFGLDWVLPFLDPAMVASLGGRLDGRIMIDGTPDQPTLDGRLVVSSAGARIPTLGVHFRDVRVVALARGSDIVIDTANVATSDGTMVAAGTLTLTDSIPLDLEATLDDFLAVANEQYRATVSGTLHVGGWLFAPVVEGDVDVQSLDVYMDELVGMEGLEEVVLSEEDLRMLRERFGYLPERQSTRAPISDRLTADIEVDLGRDSWLRSEATPEMAVAFTGRLTAHLRPGQDPDLDGSVQVIEGRGFIEQFGRRFEPAEGTVTFLGPPGATRLDLSATYTVPSYGDPDNAEATIILNVEGTQDSLSLELSSDPPMENADIVSYIATGRPAAGALSFGGDGDDGGLVSAGANLAVGQVLGAVEGAAEQSVGLDVVEIRREGLREATLVAGKYVSPRLYVGFAQPVNLREGAGLSLGGEGSSEIEIELQALRWLLLNIEGSDSALSLFLRGRYAY